VAGNDSGLRNQGMEDLLVEVERLRAEKAILQAELDKQEQRLSRGHFARRGTLTWIFIILACPTAILAPMAVWARRSIMDTNSFANKVGSLVADDLDLRSPAPMLGPVGRGSRQDGSWPPSSTVGSPDDWTATHARSPADPRETEDAVEQHTFRNDAVRLA
jgi:hypothetical protein